MMEKTKYSKLDIEKLSKVKTKFYKRYKMKGKQRQNVCAVYISTVRNKFKCILQ